MSCQLYDATTDSVLLTVAEVASLLRVSKMTVYRLLRSGELLSLRVGRSLRVPRTALDAYLTTAVQR